MVTCVTKCASKMSFDFGPKIYLRGAKSSILIHGGYGHRPPQIGSWILFELFGCLDHDICLVVKFICAFLQVHRISFPYHIQCCFLVPCFPIGCV